MCVCISTHFGSTRLAVLRMHIDSLRGCRHVAFLDDGNMYYDWHFQSCWRDMVMVICIFTS